MMAPDRTALHLSHIDDGTFVPYYSKLVVHAGGEFQVNNKVSLVPGVVLFDQGPSFQVNGGTSIRFAMGSSVQDDQSFELGAWVRVANAVGETDPESTTLLTDAVILMTRFDYRNYGIGFSYDINVSSLRQASNSNGSFEFSLVYNICGPQRRGVYCPKF